jgi:rod shape determining protein RodA
MLEYAGSQAGRRTDRDEGLALVGVLRSLDWLMLSGVAGLVAVGLWAVSGATRFAVAGNPSYYVHRQMVYAAVGGAALLVGLFVDSDVYRRYWKAIFGSIVLLIVFVLLVGHAARGSTRWISLGFFTFQPSEFGKLGFVLAIAGFIANRGRESGTPGTTLRVLGLGALPIVLVFAQPDLGTALVYFAALTAMLFVGGTSWRQLAALGSVAVLLAVGVLWAGPAAGVNFLKSYQQARLTCFVHPSRCSDSDTRYNLEQSMVAVGAGQEFGRGVHNSTQTNLNFLPEHGTDFVFASFGEQHGFAGAAVLLALYLLVLWRALRIVSIARDFYAAIVAGGIVIALLFQIFVNVGMTMGIAPITGIPLPFVSVGGSSMIANLAAMGVLLSIYARGRAARRKR